MSKTSLGVGVEVKRLLLVKREADPETGQVYQDREPIETLEWTKEHGLRVIQRREQNASDDSR